MSDSAPGKIETKLLKHHEHKLTIKNWYPTLRQPHVYIYIYVLLHGTPPESNMFVGFVTASQSTSSTYHPLTRHLACSTKPV